MVLQNLGVTIGNLLSILIIVSNGVVDGSVSNSNNDVAIEFAHSGGSLVVLSLVSLAPCSLSLCNNAGLFDRSIDLSLGSILLNAQNDPLCSAAGNQIGGVGDILNNLQFHGNNHGLHVQGSLNGSSFNQQLLNIVNLGGLANILQQSIQLSARLHEVVLLNIPCIVGNGIQSLDQILDSALESLPQSQVVGTVNLIIPIQILINAAALKQRIVMDRIQVVVGLSSSFCICIPVSIHICSTFGIGSDQVPQLQTTLGLLRIQRFNSSAEASRELSLAIGAQILNAHQHAQSFFHDHQVGILTVDGLQVSQSLVQVHTGIQQHILSGCSHLGVHCVSNNNGEFLTGVGVGTLVIDDLDRLHALVIYHNIGRNRNPVVLGSISAVVLCDDLLASFVNGDELIVRSRSCAVAEVRVQQTGAQQSHFPIGQFVGISHQLAVRNFLTACGRRLQCRAQICAGYDQYQSKDQSKAPCQNRLAFFHLISSHKSAHKGVLIL